MPTRNRAAFLPTSVEAALRDPVVDELVVVVDGADAGSVTVLERHAAADDRLRPLPIARRGEAGARAAGAAAARADVLLFVDDDVVLEPGTAAGHLAHHADLADLVVVGYLPVVTGGVAARLYSEAYEGRCSVYEADPSDVLRHLWAGNFSMPRALATRVLPKAASYPAEYHADRHLGLLLLEAGATGLFDRRLGAHHHFIRDVAGFTRDCRRQGAAAAVIHALHPLSAGPLPLDRFRQGLPRTLSRLVDLCRRPRAASAASVALQTLIAAAAMPGGEPVQDGAARLLRRIEQQRGAIDVHWSD